ncbi:MAG: branched-chain amino acid ABC transporter substrate-binding protein, partial [Actinomycetota bacterium]|nr:branched-chain amino acid ABC transporter substrate-binding protein [Actinomycetota bacterium]
MIRAKQISALVLAASISIFAVACGGSDDSDSGSSETWKIGLEAPITGDLSVLGDGMLKGAQQAASEINEDGGLLDRDVEIVPIDDAGDPATGVKAANAAIKDGLDGVVGPYNSGVGIETLPLYIKDGLVPIRLTSDDATNGLGFTLQPMTYQIAPVASEAMTKWLDAKSVAIAYDETEAYTKTEAKSVRSELEKAGVDVAAYEPIKPGAKDYSSEVSKLAATNADVVYLVTYFPEGGLMAKEMQAQNVKSQCLADYGSYDTGFIDTAGTKAAEACPVVGVPAPGDFQDASSYVDTFNEEFDQEPGTWSPYTYDSVKFLADGVEAADGFDETKLSDELGKVSGWTGWTGEVTINPDNGTREPGTVAVVSTQPDGTFKVNPEWA